HPQGSFLAGKKGLSGALCLVPPFISSCYARSQPLPLIKLCEANRRSDRAKQRDGGPASQHHWCWLCPEAQTWPKAGLGFARSSTPLYKACTSQRQASFE